MADRKNAFPLLYTTHWPVLQRWRECRLTHTCWINIILHKMNVNRFWCFAVTNHAVLVEIVFVRHTIFECQSSIQRIADGINNGTFSKVGRCIGIHHNTAVNGATYSLDHGLPFSMFRSSTCATYELWQK